MNCRLVRAPGYGLRSKRDFAIQEAMTLLAAHSNERRNPNLVGLGEATEVALARTRKGCRSGLVSFMRLRKSGVSERILAAGAKIRRPIT